MTETVSSKRLFKLIAALLSWFSSDQLLKIDVISLCSWEDQSPVPHET